MNKKCGKSVRFAEDANISHECREGHEDDDHSLIYTPRSEYLEGCKKVGQESREYQETNVGIHLENIYGCSFDEQIDRLVALHLDAESARGLERHINEQHREERSKMRRRLIQAVLNQQQTHLKANLGYDQRSSVLASIAGEQSYTARFFARAVAIADEKVAEDEFNPTPSQESLALTSKRGTRRSTSGTLANMVKKIGRSKSKHSKQRRRYSPTTSGEEFFENFDLIVSVQDMY